MRIAELVMCGSVYSYILTIRHYAPNTLLALPNLPNRQILVGILVNTCSENQFLQLFVNLHENAQECYS